MSEKLKELYAARQLAGEKLARKMADVFPVGTNVLFRISSKQTNPSSGEVTGHRKNGYLIIKHHQAKKHSRYAYRNIFFEYVVMADD